MSQLICINNNCLDKLHILIEDIKPNKVFIVTGRKSYKLCGAETKISKILKDINTVQFSEFNNNPNIDDVLRGMDLFRKSNCDLIMAIGGGSVIDMAKLINIFTGQKCPPINIIKKTETVTNKGVPLIAIPTTAGSGSEATHFAVLYVENQKYSIAHEYILPDYIFIHSEFTFNSPSYLTACTGVDALSQAIESMWSIHSTEESIAYSKDAIKLIKEHLPKAVLSNNKEARKAMSNASFLAGKAINIAKTTAPHAISYPFTSIYQIPHGHAVALTLPLFIDYNYNLTSADCNDKRGVNFVKKNIEEICQIFDTSPRNCKEVISAFILGLDIEIDIKKLIGDKFNPKTVLNCTNFERLNNNPRSISVKNIKDFLTINIIN
jgi:alcohol dehydrogenase class IV